MSTDIVPTACHGLTFTSDNSVRHRYLISLLVWWMNVLREYTTCLRSHSCVVEKGIESRKSDSRVSKDNSWLVEVLNSLSSLSLILTFLRFQSKKIPFPFPSSFSLPSPWFYFFCYLCLGCSPHCFIFPIKTLLILKMAVLDVANSIMNLTWSHLSDGGALAYSQQDTMISTWIFCSTYYILLIFLFLYYC